MAALPGRQRTVNVLPETTEEARDAALSPTAAAGAGLRELSEEQRDAYRRHNTILTQFCVGLHKQLNGGKKKKGASTSAAAATPAMLPRQPARVQLTAMAYMRRFFVANSLRLWDPYVLSVACIFVAGKVEAAYISLDALCEASGQNADAVLEHEAVLLEGLGFHLHICHPLSPMAGALRTAQHLFHLNDEQQTQAMGDWDTAARKRLLQVMATSVGHRFPPSIIALAALHDTAPDEPCFDVQEFVRSADTAPDVNAVWSDVLAVIEEWTQELHALKTADVAALLREARPSSGVTAAKKRKR